MPHPEHHPGDPDEADLAPIDSSEPVDPIDPVESSDSVDPRHRIDAVAGLGKSSGELEIPELGTNSSGVAGRRRDVISAIDRILGADGALARAQKGYEERSQQLEMARYVSEALESEGAAVIEAGTGTGKTLAYLVPALLSGKRVVVSTATKALQEQLVQKDLPLLQKLGARFRFALMKGRQNYLCLLRKERFEAEPVFTSLADKTRYPEIRAWAETTRTGDRAELELPENYGAWREISSTSETCVGQDCERWDDCFVVRMRQQAQEADIVVVNHHLFFADLALRGTPAARAGVEIIPRYEAIIFDEAHKIEETATEFFGVQSSNFRFFDLCHDLDRTTGQKDDWPGEEISRVTSSLGRAADGFFRYIATLAPVDPSMDRVVRSGEAGRKAGPRRKALKPKPEVAPAIGSLFDPRPKDAPREIAASDEEVLSRAVVLAPTGEGDQRSDFDGRWSLEDEALALLSERAEPLTSALQELSYLLEGLAEVHSDAEIEVYQRRVEELGDSLQVFLEPRDPSLVYWAEQRGRGVFLRASPVDVSGTLANRLFDGEKAVIMTSATLATGGHTRFFQGRIGLRFGEESRMPTVEAVLPSPFDYTRQAALYLPRHLPEPNAPEFMEQAVEELAALIALAKGRTFALFTSTRAMQEAHRRLAHRIPYRVLLQGERSKSALLEAFREEPSVLFATQSFWEGVDVQGDALSMVVIDKLPFASPGDPLVSARLNHITSRGGSPFAEYQMPSAAISLKQGFGRLIRSRRDSGAVAILDRRLWTKSYGGYFRKSLPGCPTFDRFPDLKHWWREVRRKDEESG